MLFWRKRYFSHSNTSVLIFHHINILIPKQKFKIHHLWCRHPWIFITFVPLISLSRNGSCLIVSLRSITIIRPRSSNPHHPLHHSPFTQWQNIIIKPRQTALHGCIHQNSRAPLWQGNKGSHALLLERWFNHLGIFDIASPIYSGIVQGSSPQFLLLSDGHGIPCKIHTHSKPK